MEQYVSFLTNHWILSSLFVVFLVAFLINELIQQKTGGSVVSPEEAVQLMNHHDASVIDLRLEEAYKAGHILGSHNIPAGMIEKRKTAVEKMGGKALILICSVGQDSSRVAAKLKQAGMKVVVLKGGLEAWKAAGLPLKKK